VNPAHTNTDLYNYWIAVAANDDFKITIPAGARMTFGYFNPAAFCPPPAIGDGTGYGNTGRAAFRGPHQANFDVSLAKSTRVGGLSEAASVEFRAEFFNAFNHPQFANPGTTVGTPSFGKIQATSVAPRLIQFGLKYIF